MKRPFVVIAAVSLAVSFALLYFEMTGLIIASASALLAWIVALFVFRKSHGKNTNIFIVIPSCIILLLLSAFITLRFSYDTTSRLADSRTSITATVISEPTVSSGNKYCSFKGRHPETGQGFKFSAIVDDEKLDIGDKVNLTIDFDSLDHAYKNHNLSERIFIKATVRSVNSLSQDADPVYTLLGNLRSFIKKVIFSNSKGDPAAILTALVTGDRNGISNELYSATVATGVTHFLVVSGLHLSIISGAITNIFKKLRSGKRIAVFVVFIAISIMVVICNFHSSAIRSAVMSLILLSAPLIHRRADSLNSLGFTVTVMITVNPFLAGSAAFILSVFATFGVIYLAPALFLILKELFLGDNPKKLTLNALSVFVVSLSALITIFPISVYYFGVVSLLSPIVTLLISFAVNAALVLTLAAIAISVVPFGNFIATAVILISSLFAEFIIFIITLFARFDFAVLAIDSSLANVFVVISALFVATVRFIYHKKLKERKMKDAALREEP